MITNVKLIHSHNNMSVFFSGTDVSELEDNAPNHEYYLSLIVNNKGDKQAKVCHVAKRLTKFQKRNSDTLQFENFQDELEEEVLIIYNCEIVEECQNIEVSKEFEERTSEIIKIADSKPKYTAYKHYQGGNYKTYYTNNKINTTSKKEKKSLPTNYSTGYLDFEENDLGWGNSSYEDYNQAYIDWEPKIDLMEVEFFAYYLVALGTTLSEKMSLEEILDYYVKNNISADKLAKDIEKEFENCYKLYFKQDTEYLVTEVKKRFLEELILEIKDYKAFDSGIYVEYYNKIIETLQKIWKQMK